MQVRGLAVSLLLLLISSSARASETNSQERIAVWTHPLTALLSGTLGFGAPLSVSTPAWGNRDVVFEGLVFGRPDPLDSLPSRRVNGLLTSIGLTFRDGNRRGWSLFATPKLTGGLLSNPVVGSAFFAGRSAWTLQGGGDVGVELRAGNLLVGAALGASVGYCDTCAEGLLMPLNPLGSPLRRGPQSGGVVWMLNLNLLRLGFTL